MWHSELAINFTGHSKAEDLSNEIPLRHSQTNLVGHAPKCGHPEGERGFDSGGAADTKANPMARQLVVDCLTI